MRMSLQKVKMLQVSKCLIGPYFPAAYKNSS